MKAVGNWKIFINYLRISLPLFCFMGVSEVSGVDALRRLVFDDYYQKPREDRLFMQGVARGGPELRNLTNFYSPTATAVPNGTFILSELIADAFKVELGKEPISEVMLKDVDAYMMICPIRKEMGGRADLTEEDAEVLRSFVAEGGLLILVANSLSRSSDISKSEFDFEGLNRIGRKFGVEFLPSETETLSIPIPVDQPHFDGVKSLIFGNGSILKVLPDAPAEVEILLEIESQNLRGPVAALASLGKGRALFFGDGGTFGNAHAFRTDLGQAKAMQQMFFALLPSGPVPAYGWSPGLTLKAKVTQEQIVSAYPEYIDFFRLPYPDEVEVYSSGMREIDLENQGTPPNSVNNKDFVSIVASTGADFELRINEVRGYGFEGEWLSEDGGRLVAWILRNGRFVQPQLPFGKALEDWQHILLHEAVLAPLRSYAQSGTKWTATVPTALPQLQLQPIPHIVEAESTIQFEGLAEINGQQCYKLIRRTWVDGHDWRFDDLVDASAAISISAVKGLEIFAAGQLIVARYWISADRLLPVRTEIAVSGALWWTDPRFPAHYRGYHDSKNYELWDTTNFVATFGRRVQVEFSAP